MQHAHVSQGVALPWDWMRQGRKMMKAAGEGEPGLTQPRHLCAAWQQHAGTTKEERKNEGRKEGKVGWDEKIPGANDRVYHHAYRAWLKLRYMIW